ncbi:MAG: hypothetical protein GYB66_02995 [Chloroflexi bacterium]|nr:hypothetical protein [Chloroflexota bacterium]
MPESSPNSGRYGTFDNRYRYDHIYPRGRSGETLRAWDPEDNDRPVVIKRPAPQDAPPMRAAQEVSIRAERKALERLTGHPVLTELWAHGTFRVGGQTHEYIVMDRAAGQIVADMVIDLAEQGERLPTLEMLVIVDRLLDLISAAHDQQIVYNDVDAKHLFWDRSTYQLKVIDWGNAVLLDEGGTHNVTRQTDVFQVGELLYFIISGGKRLDSETTPTGDYAVIFGIDATHAPASLQAIITRATQPNLRKRYTTIMELRQHLAEIRQPLEERRDRILTQVEREMSSRHSHQELATFLDDIDKAVALDPGYPRTHELRSAIEAELHRLEIQADIDAGRIYLDTANWPRAIETMLDLLERADEQNAPVIRFIIAAAELLENRQRSEPPPALSAAIDELMRQAPQQAGVILATSSEGEDNLLLAERLATLVPEVVLLRPPLVAIRSELSQLSNAEDVLPILEAIDDVYRQRPDTPTLSDMIRQYREIGQQLENLTVLLEGAGATGERHLEMLSSAEAALTTIINQLQTVSRCVYSDPPVAGEALRAANRIDPVNPYFEEINNYFEEIHLAVSAISSFKPKSDGTNLNDWFIRVVDLLSPYKADLHDRALHQSLEALQSASDLWRRTLDAYILGRRSVARANLSQIAQLMEPLNTNISNWAKSQANSVKSATHVELMSPNTSLAQALVEGYQVWDQGKHAYAAELAERLVAQAETQGEQLAIERLQKLGRIAADWFKNNGPQDYEVTDRAESEVTRLFLPAEEDERDSFAKQMPNEGAYLKSMARGLVDTIRRNSTAGVRILFLHYTWRGMLCVLEDTLDDAEFWREAALKTIPEGRNNPVFVEFDNSLAARRLILEAQTALNQIESAADLPGTRSLLNQPLADQVLSEAQRAIRHLEVGVRNWEDGDFRAAREAFETAIQGINAAEQQANMDLGPLKSWVTPLRDAVGSLQTSRLKVEEIAHVAKVPEAQTDELVNPVVEQVLQSIVQTTEKHLGTDHSAQVRQWLSTYQAVRETHQNTLLTKSEKLVAFQAHFASLFINKHPTYRLFQVWREMAQRLPDEFAEPSPAEDGVGFVDDGADDGDDVPPRTTKAASPGEQPLQSDPTQAETTKDDVVYEEQRMDIPWTILVMIGVVIVGILIFALTIGFGEEDSDADNRSDRDDGLVASTQDGLSGAASPQPVPTTVVPVTAVPTEAPATTEPTTAVPSDTPEQATPTATLTRTQQPSPTPVTATNTLPPTTIAPTVPPTSLAVDDPFGSQDVLRALNAMDISEYAWELSWFGPGAGGLWQLGTSQSTAGDGPIVVKMPPSFLETLYGTRAAERLISVEAVMELTVGEDQPNVFFGLGLENEAGRRVAAEIRVPRQNIISWGINEGGNFSEVTSFASDTYRVDVRITRNTDGTLSLFVDNQQLGQSAARYGDGIALTPVLYTSGDGVFVVISSLQYQFSPIQ